MVTNVVKDWEQHEIPRQLSGKLLVVYYSLTGNAQRIASPDPRPPRASTVPPACVTMCLTIASPSPVPREARARSARKNRSNSRGSSVLGRRRRRRRRRAGRPGRPMRSTDEREVTPRARHSGSRSRRDSGRSPAACVGGSRARSPGRRRADSWTPGTGRPLAQTFDDCLELRQDGNRAERDDPARPTRAR